MNKRSLIVLLLLMGLCRCVCGQVLQLPYFCGFEDAVENANWRFASSTQNGWTVGDEEKLDGDSAMYVVNWSGSREVIGTNANANYMSLYRVVTLNIGTRHEISFDWKNPGYGNGELYVCWVPDSENISNYSSSVYDMPSWVKNFVVVQSDSILTGASIWQNVTFEVMGTGNPYKLLFFFRSKGTSRHPSGRDYPAACLDNIQIAKKTACLRPRNLTYEHIDASRGLFSWEGDLGPFELKYKAVNEENWQTAKNLSDFNQVTLRYELPIRPLRKGAYIASIRQICDKDTSIWSVFPNLFVHFSDNNCLDFINLNGFAVECYTGTFDNPFQSGVRNANDFGFASGLSRQTIHYLDDEYDVRTNYKLETTPPDGMPSVRLGNWNIGAEAEAITYTYSVTEEAPLLLLKYAIVLEDPGHNTQNQPRFEMIITDGYGNEVDELLCGQANFKADKTDPSWEWGASGSDSQTIFKKWTSTGLNLQNFKGQDIKITLITRDCSQTGHYGYGYFTMDCMGAKISGVGCGDSMFGTIEAPEGFRYKWYPKEIKKGVDEDADEDAVQAWFAQPDYADTLQSFTPPGDTSDDGIFVCRMISIDASECWFELEANLDPRDVYTGVTSELKIENCEAKMRFANNSYTKTRNRGDIGVCELFEWDFGNGITSYEESPVAIFDPGTYHVTMKASISEGLCFGVWDSTIVIPDFGNTVDTIHAVTCTASPNYTFEGVTYNTTGIRTAKYTSVYGCDSIRVLDLVVNEEITKEYRDTTTTEDEYNFYGRILTESGTYDHRLTSYNGGCDTLVTLHLVVRPVLRIDMDPVNLPEICFGDSEFAWAYTIRTGTLETYDVSFDRTSLDVGFENLIDVPHIDGLINIPLPATAIPGNYSAVLEFDGDTTGLDTIVMNFDIYYPSDIIRQKWNNVIAVTNADYNGGYNFSAFRWYVDGVLIPEVLSSYLYIPEGTLKMSSEYRVKLTRLDDGVTTFSCPFIPEDRDSLQTGEYPTVFPTKAPKKSAVTVRTVRKGSVSIYDIMGRHICRYSVREGETQVLLPDRAGFYILKIEMDDKQTSVVRVMVTE